MEHDHWSDAFLAGRSALHARFDEPFRAWARGWAEPRPAWAACERGDFVLFALGEQGLHDRTHVALLYEGVRPLLSLAPPDDRWCRSGMALAAGWLQGRTPDRQALRKATRGLRLHGRQDALSVVHTRRAISAVVQAVWRAVEGRPPARSGLGPWNAAHFASLAVAASTAPEARDAELARWADLARARTWPLGGAAVDRASRSARPGVQVAWDLAQQHATSDRLDTVDVLVARSIAPALERTAGGAEAAERAVLAAAAEHALTAVDPDAVLRELHAVLRQRA